MSIPCPLDDTYFLVCHVDQGTPVLQMTAVDGDAGSHRKIVYELVSSKLIILCHTLSY